MGYEHHLKSMRRRTRDSTAGYTENFKKSQPPNRPFHTRTEDAAISIRQSIETIAFCPRIASGSQYRILNSHRQKRRWTGNDRDADCRASRNITFRNLTYGKRQRLFYGWGKMVSTAIVDSSYDRIDRNHDRQTVAVRTSIFRCRQFLPNRHLCLYHLGFVRLVRPGRIVQKKMDSDIGYGDRRCDNDVVGDSVLLSVDTLTLDDPVRGGGLSRIERCHGCSQSRENTVLRIYLRMDGPIGRRFFPVLTPVDTDRCDVMQSRAKTPILPYFESIFKIPSRHSPDVMPFPLRIHTDTGLRHHKNTHETGNTRATPNAKRSVILPEQINRS